MRRIFWIFLPAWCLTAWLLNPTISFAQVALQDRIVQAIDQNRMTALHGNIHPLARADRDQGRVNPGMQMQGVSLAFRLSANQQAALDQLLAQQQDRTSANYHKWLTPEQYAARFGMSQGDLDRVTTWLQSQGFTDIQVSRGRTRVSFNGTVARVEAAFRTEIHDYQVDGEAHFANATDPALPAAFADTVLGFRHLDNFRPKPRVRPNAHFTSSQTGNHFLTPGDFATIYDLGPLYTSGFDGSGIKIVVVGQTLIDVTDANKFRSLSGLSLNPPQLLLTPNTGTSQTFTGDLDEANIDVEWSGGVAKNATVIFDYSGSTGNVFDALSDAIDNNRAPVIGISYGNCETSIGSLSVVQGLRTLAQQGVSQGQTVSAASGDDGAADCDGNDPTPVTVASHGLSVDVPAAIPEVVGVGGTEFMGDNTPGSDPPFWAVATSGTIDNISSALSYIPEMAWNDTTTAVANGGDLSASGGGVSTIFAKPYWQGPLTLNDGQRDVPDISVSGSNGHDSYLVCSQGSCVTGFRDSGGGLNAFGGTSVSAQAFAGILAIINQATGSNGLGNANIVLYGLANDAPSAFHDIPAGSNNTVPCTQGSTNCPATAPFQIGFNTKAGYDLVTGLGSIDANKLVMAWPKSATYFVFPSPATISSPGGAATSTVTITPEAGFTGSVTLSCAAPGSEIACSFTAPTVGATTSVTITSATAATATLSIKTTAAHAIASPSAKTLPGSGFGWFTAGGGTLLAGFLMIGMPRRRRRPLSLMGLLFCVCLAVGVGCGGGTQTDPGTPAGNYTITVTGTFGAITKTANVTVVVQ